MDRRVHKLGWPDGPWSHEPDRVTFTHEGLPCLILRRPIGALCGYVAVPVGHPAHKKGCVEAERQFGIEVHGGLGFAGPMMGEGDMWWFGFDCAHGGDLVPATAAWLSKCGLGKRSVYRSIEYVIQEVRKLANQLVAIDR